MKPQFEPLNLASKEGLLQLLQDWQEVLLEDLTAFLGVDEQTEFFVETTFLQNWSKNPHGLLRDEDLEDLVVSFEPVDLDDPNGHRLVQIQLIRQPDSNTDDEVNEVLLRLTPNYEHTKHYALEIIRDRNRVYERTAAMDEHTEWILNEMANDLTDENGKFIFEGDPVNI